MLNLQPNSVEQLIVKVNEVSISLSRKIHCINDVQENEKAIDDLCTLIEASVVASAELFFSADDVREIHQILESFFNNQVTINEVNTCLNKLVKEDNIPELLKFYCTGRYHEAGFVNLERESFQKTKFKQEIHFQNREDLHEYIVDLFEQCDQGLDKLCLLAIKSIQTGDLELQNEFRQFLKQIKSSINELYQFCNFSKLNSRVSYWLKPNNIVSSKVVQNRAGLASHERNRQLHLDHDSFREKKLLVTREKWKYQVDHLIDFVESYFAKWQIPNFEENHLVYTAEMEYIRKDVIDRAFSFRKEALMYQNAFLDRPFPVSYPKIKKILNPSTGRQLKDLTLNIVEGSQCTELVDSILQIANADLVFDSNNTPVSRTGIIEPYKREEFIHKLSDPDSIVVSINKNNKMLACMVLLSARSQSSEGLFQKYFDERYASQIKKSAIVKYAGTSKELIQDLIKSGIESPFDLMHSFLISHLKHRSARYLSYANQSFREVRRPTQIEYLLCQVRSKPSNDPVLSVLDRNLGLKSDLKYLFSSRGYEFEREIYMLPASFIGFSNSMLFYNSTSS